MKIEKEKFFYALSVTLSFLLLDSCAPKEPVVFKDVKNITVEIGNDGKPILRGDVSFYNPNKLKMKLKKVDVEILVNGNKSAEVDQELNLIIPGQSDFSVPITAQLNLKEGGLLNTVFGLLGGKKYEVTFTGYIRIAVHGITIKVPVSQKQEIKLR